MIFREDFGCKYEAWNGRVGERKVRTQRAVPAPVRLRKLSVSDGARDGPEHGPQDLGSPAQTCESKSN
jgi:hypothetical protein